MTHSTLESSAPEAPKRLIDLLILGDVNVDLIVSGGEVPEFGQAEQLVDGTTLALGGSGAIVACGAARLGLTVALVAVVGDDIFGRFALAELARLGVDRSHLIVRDDVSTGCSCVLSLGGERDRAMLTHLGAIAALTRGALPDEAIAMARHVHVASPFLQDGLRADLAKVLSQARAAGATTSLDPNWDPRGEWNIDDLLAHVDLLLPNATEALMLSDESGVERAASELARRGPRVVVKLGAGGALASDGESMIRVASPALGAVDSTGAGDTFDAAYLAAALGGADEAERLEHAVIAGALSVRGAGGTSCQPDRDEIATFRADRVATAEFPPAGRRALGSAMAAELSSQPDMWRRVLALPDSEYAKLPAKGETVLALGAGSSRYMLESWAARRENGDAGSIRVHVASEFRHFSNGAANCDVVLVLSRSGTSTDTLRALQAVPRGIPRVGIVGVADSPIAAACDRVVTLDFADEQSVVQTRFATSALALLRRHDGEELASVVQDGERALHEPVPTRPGSIRSFVFLGTGASIALAHEAALKCREAAKLHTEAYAVGEYRHGPIACANSQTLVWSFAPVEDSLAAAIAATGAILFVGRRDPLAELVAVHRLALAEAIHRGLDADTPAHLERSVILDG